ncbi:alkaline shock response membrane anchor protein AmaP [Streptomyces sp. CB01635]|uniref:alkaline shock response membrane anchor protein AmaP n=1 Tax=Streptomyces sp. CB01635 TaxID=2020326 RepID=UPI000C2728CD|nr:alkaline shock response membrane anchor protein AmaP [Streptomyces sp. CB01635]PJN09463.1 alkaline shock response membrane anchor protein AmaP [Streptomyces sp. CB01635]
MNGRSTLNRLLMALSGLVLLGGGLLILTAGLDLYRRLHLAAPAGWPLTTPHDVLLSNVDRIGWSDQGWWWWPAVIAGLVLAAVFALLWLLAQLRHRPGSVHLGGTPPPESVELRGRALSDAVTAEARALPGVEQASTHVTGRAARPSLHVALTLTDHGTPAPVLQALCHGPVAHARDCTGLPHLATRARLDVGKHKAHRAD